MLDDMRTVVVTASVVLGGSVGGAVPVVVANVVGASVATSVVFSAVVEAFVAAADVVGSIVVVGGTGTVGVLRLLFVRLSDADGEMRLEFVNRCVRDGVALAVMERDGLRDASSVGDTTAVQFG